MKDFIVGHFDKLLVAFFVLLMVAVVLALSQTGADASTVSWAREVTSSFIGALIGLITGISIGREKQ
jgi:hypothetical protein